MSPDSYCVPIRYYIAMHDFGAGGKNFENTNLDCQKRKKNLGN